MAKDREIRAHYLQTAETGDADAQYRVGRSYCCAPSDQSDAFYNNRSATEFLCRSARQGHAAAAFELGRIHAGERVEGIRLLRRAATLARDDAADNRVLAYYWFTQAWRNGHGEAAKRLQQLGEQDISAFGEPTSTPCTLDEAYGGP